MTLPHVTTWSAADLSAFDALDPMTDEGRAAYNLVAHQVLKRDGEVPEEEALGGLAAQMGTSVDAVNVLMAANPDLVAYNVAALPRPILDLCRPGAFDPLPFVEGVRALTGMHGFQLVMCAGDVESEAWGWCDTGSDVVQVTAVVSGPHLAAAVIKASAHAVYGAKR